MRDTSQVQSPASSLLPQLAVAAGNGTAVDLLGYQSAAVIFNLGVFTGTGPTATLDIKDSPDNVTFTSVPAAKLQGGALPAITPATANQLIQRGYLGTQRYLRCDITAEAGTTPSLPISAIVVRDNPQIAPTTATE